jgi:hypothetical protein
MAATLSAHADEPHGDALDWVAPLRLRPSAEAGATIGAAMAPRGGLRFWLRKQRAGECCWFHTRSAAVKDS